ncbi:MAG: hypothetical protein G3M78_01415 [Candidatus Nitrohelix vancouverensis]|uniref:Uncharacterized protein n=1 Tax=Candidatus Nitrohelix vancouverensis TaxID=2705534 RepID=A0A7T0G2A7_9BACT|nr:MAG: hypothetical protein G3M78_01415 [Candidatus Nitrohelix vancouverensis]
MEYVEELPLDGDLTGLTVLDVGAWDGLLSFECERRGAFKVLATDIWAIQDFDHDWWGQIRSSDMGFLTVKKLLGSNVHSKTLSVYDISQESVRNV